jgi:hypothetical protein
MDPAETESHQRTEERIVGHADHGFDAAGDHRLDEDAVNLIGGDQLPPAGHDFREGAADRGRLLEVQAHAADVGLVLHGARRQLGRDGESENARQGDRFVRRSRERSGGQR